MAEVFDPYHTWLGIAPEEQPADHYRLLNVGRFESDPDVISNAADQRMGHVRKFQAGKHARDAVRILNELATARVCLLDGENKAAYDNQLRAALLSVPQDREPSGPPAARGRPSVVRPPVADSLQPPAATTELPEKPPAPPPPLAKRGPATGEATAKPPSFWHTPLGVVVLAGGPALAVFVLVVVVGLLVIFVGPSGSDEDQPGRTDGGTRTAVLPGMTAPSANDPDDFVWPPKPRKSFDTFYLSTEVLPRSERPPSPGFPRSRGSSSAREAPWQGARDEWLYRSGAFKKVGSRWDETSGRSTFRYRETERTVEYVEMIDDSRGVVIRLSDDSCILHRKGWDDWARYYSGGWKGSFTPLRGDTTLTSPRDGVADKTKIDVGPHRDLLISIRPLALRLNHVYEKQRWLGPPPPYSKHFYITSNQADSPAILRLQHQPPPEYVLICEVERWAGDGAFIIGLTVGGRPVNLVIDDLQPVGYVSGLTLIDSHHPGSALYPATYRGTLLKTKRWSQIVIAVRNNEVIVNCDGRTVQHWEGDPNLLTPKWPAPDHDGLYIGNDKTSFRISRIEMRPIGGPQKPADG